MQLSKHLLLPVLVCLSSYSFADPITLYGKANVTVQSSDEGGDRFTETQSNNSRIGVKGETKLDGGLTAFYLIEFGVDLADLSGSDNIKSRNQYVGLKGDFGAVMIGRNDTMLKQTQGKLDQFNDYEADLKGIWKGENRLSDTITYISPKFGDFTVGLTYVAEDEEDGEDGTSVSLNYGDKNLKKSAIYASVAADFDVAGYDIVRAAIQSQFDALTLGAMLQKQEAVNSGDSKEGAMVSAAYKMGKITYKGQFQTLEDDTASSIGADYKLGASTKIFAWYTVQSLDDAKDKNWLAVGLDHKF
ncbi:porin [Neptunicella sp. SCSIO 80796]|uniref:porin n=1 Tax=Neptunicella plasticusilytica TaxID=3117012 RepID=UPI003A4DBF8A